MAPRPGARQLKTQRRRHEIETVELALDTGGSSYRVRLFNPAIAARRAA